ncbi:Forkhead box protein O1 [Manis javanica]|nr:Forkhead box protein O1 [Manis javanica]
MLMDPRSSGSAKCSAAPSSRCACAGGTDLAPQPRIASSRPLGSRRRSRRFSALPRWRRAAVTLAEALQVVRINPDFKPLPRPDFSQSNSATSSRRRRPARTGTPTLPWACLRPRRRPRNAWGNLSHADRIAKPIEGLAEKRLPLLQICSGGSRAGRTSGMKATGQPCRLEGSPQPGRRI